jgi:hypothetical protein
VAISWDFLARMDLSLPNKSSSSFSNFLLSPCFCDANRISELRVPSLKPRLYDSCSTHWSSCSLISDVFACICVAEDSEWVRKLWATAEVKGMAADVTGEGGLGITVVGVSADTPTWTEKTSVGFDRYFETNSALTRGHFVFVLSGSFLNQSQAGELRRRLPRN